MKRLQFSLATLVLVVVIAAMGIALYQARNEAIRWQSQAAKVERESARRNASARDVINDTVARAKQIANDKRQLEFDWHAQHTQFIHHLIEGLGHDSPTVRRWCAETLGRIGDDARLAVPALMEATSDPDEPVRVAAESALKKIEPAETEP